MRSELDARFRFILIDEYQDTNQAQYEIARLLSVDYRNLCVVGDPDQSIYKWRGSDIRNILDFERDYADARVITLDKNYRSTKAILHAAGTLITHNKQRKKKALVTDNAAGQPVKTLIFDTGLDEADARRRADPQCRPRQAISLSRRRRISSASTPSRADSGIRLRQARRTFPDRQGPGLLRAQGEQGHTRLFAASSQSARRYLVPAGRERTRSRDR